MQPTLRLGKGELRLLTSPRLERPIAETAAVIEGAYAHHQLGEGGSPSGSCRWSSPSGGNGFAYKAELKGLCIVPGLLHPSAALL